MKPAMESHSPHLVIMPTPAMGHLIPLTQFAETLLRRHNFSATFIIPDDGSSMKPQKRLLQSQPTSISTIFLPPVSFDDLPADTPIETRINLSFNRSLGHLRNSLKSLTESTRVVALVVDIFGMDAFEIAHEFGILPYIFLPISGLTVSLFVNIPKLDETYSCEYGELTEPIRLPGCVPVHVSDLSDSMLDKKDEAYKFVLHIAKKCNSAVGILVNSFMDLEPGAFKSLIEDESVKPPVYPVGPLTRSGSTEGGIDEWECLKWLDKQPNRSVLYVCFGSGGTLSQHQLTELAMGLEMSGQRFLWVVKRPNDKLASATFFGDDDQTDPFEFLPKGFLERTNGFGHVVRSWAPQVEILGHGSTGGFMTHCGWNSTLEGIVHGVPLIAWPLYAEQKMNAVLLAEDLKIAFRVKFDDNGVVGKEAIAKYVRSLFEEEEGRELRKKMSQLKEAAKNVLSEDGSSTKALADVAKIWKEHCN